MFTKVNILFFVKIFKPNFWKSQFTAETLSKILFSGLVASLFLNFSHPFVTSYAYILGEYKDFTVVSLYLSDIFLFAFVSWQIISRNLEFTILRHKYTSASSLLKVIPYLLLLLAYISFILNLNFGFGLVSLSWLMLLIKGIVLYETIAISKTDFRSIFFKTIITLGSLIALLALYQVAFQRSLGLIYLGEPRISSNIWGISSLWIENGLFLRPYGTLPHPNILGGFLAVSTISTIYHLLFFQFQTVWRKYFLLSLVFLQLTGLLLTLSRSAWLGFAFGLVTLFVEVWSEKEPATKEFLRYALYIGTYTCIIALILLPIILPRANIQFTNSYTQRVNLNQKAIEMISSSPVYGLGSGGNLFHMEQFFKFWIYPWEIQPVHNLYLAWAVDYGLPSVALFLAFLVLVLMKLYKSIQSTDNPDKHSWLFIALLSTILIMSLLDHYFYTLQPGVVMFWLVLAFSAFPHRKTHHSLW